MLDHYWPVLGMNTGMNMGMKSGIKDPTRLVWPQAIPDFTLVLDVR
jgi:hypothetical protein